MTDTPVSLLERLRDHPGPDAWAEFVAIYSEPLFRYALSRGLPAEDAQDVAQTIFVVLVEKLPRFVYDPRGSFTGWLMTIARNKVTDYWKEKDRRPAHVSLQPTDRVIQDDTVAESEFLTHVVHTAFERLREEFDERTVRACRECWMNDRPVADMARELGMTPNAVQLRLARARKRLAGLLRGMLE